ncbi:hypothetical protein I2I05_17965 [Hymenobacter sp. BT683]|uniref:Secreted protein n=1 Tax=Hymenobacter jeongseonensis TaxID=2791027 RepID=A0ABS0ILM8_9BACT|nr:hypothetical protein [Hymenobacter jeongseonensis]MBF9239283.1 hypothetical protein [Hymenobacter jeongseonensis]
MRKLVVLLLGSFMLCVATFTGVHASPPVPDRKVDYTECVMYKPTMATCFIDTVATVHAVILKPSLGPVAPNSLVAVDGGHEFLALLRTMTCPDNRWPGHVGVLYPTKSKTGRQALLKEYPTAGPPKVIDPGR